MPKLAGPALIGVLAAATLFPVFTADATSLSNVAESSIMVKEKQVLCDYSTTGAKLLVKDQAGNVIKQTTVGTQVSIEGIVSLYCNYSTEEPIVLFEVRDEQGISTYLAWQKFSIESGGQMVTGLSWTPDKPGDYEVRFFYLLCLNCTGVFSPVLTYEITVV